MKGLYIHIPFCISKCKYCDFYSFSPKENQKDSYLSAVLLALKKRKNELTGTFDTIYFGGGTPSFFGGNRISKIINKAKECFDFASDTEICVECNPSSVDEKLVYELKACGVNRISMGLQSAISDERQVIGRISTAKQAKEAVLLFKKAKIDNISVDLMLGLPYQTMESLKESIDFVLSLDIKHISAYILKLEEKTPLYNEKENLDFPDEDTVCDMYLYLCKVLRDNGFSHYEISNFAKEGYQSRHNNKYWLLEEYLGIGPSAHSYIENKRFYYERDFNSFLNGNDPVFDCVGADEEEFVMLSLRLSKGLSLKEFEKRFSKKFPQKAILKAKEFEKHKLLTIQNQTISLTDEGFLLSNSIISDFLSYL